MRLFVFSTLLMIMSLTACGGSDGSPSSSRIDGIDAKAAGLQGLWIQKEEAEEFRETGRIESICKEIKEDPNTSILNVRLIEADGTTYIYHPKAGKIETLKMGIITASKELSLTPSFQARIGSEATYRASVEGDVLSLIYRMDPSDLAMDISMDYLRSSDQEVSKYFSFQESCKN